MLLSSSNSYGVRVMHPDVVWLVFYFSIFTTSFSPRSAYIQIRVLRRRLPASRRAHTNIPHICIFYNCRMGYHFVWVWAYVSHFCSYRWIPPGKLINYGRDGPLSTQIDNDYNGDVVDSPFYWHSKKPYIVSRSIYIPKPHTYIYIVQLFRKKNTIQCIKLEKRPI